MTTVTVRITGEQVGTDPGQSCFNSHLSDLYSSFDSNYPASVAVGLNSHFCRSVDYGLYCDWYVVDSPGHRHDHDHVRKNDVVECCCHLRC